MPKPLQSRASQHANASRATLVPKANAGALLKGDFERLARRRYQNPEPFRRNGWWVLRYWQDEESADGKRRRKRVWAKLAPADTPETEVHKLRDERLWPVNQGLVSIGSATTFRTYVTEIYQPVIMPLLAKSTQDRYQGVIHNYLLPQFGALALRDLGTLALQRYFSSLAGSKLAHESRDKIRDVLSSVLASAVQYGYLIKNPAEAVRLPKERHGRVQSKPYVSPEQFGRLITEIPEPYATAVFVAIYTGLRISELAGLRWNDIHSDAITIDERYCRGDWGAPKSDASNATIGVNRCVIERIHRLKLLTVKVRAGRAVRKFKAVKSAAPEDLVFQSVQKGRPIRDNNILTRYLKPAGHKLGMPWLNWRCLRTSHATWLKLAGADVKDAQAQMRHSRASTTLDIYQQFVPESQRRVVEKLSTLTVQ